MSSILKALKKLENEVPEKTDVRIGPHQFYAKRAIQKRVKSNFFFNKYVFVVVTFITLIIGGGLALTIKPWIKKPATVAKPASKALNRSEKTAHPPALKQKDALSGQDKETYELSGKQKSEPLGMSENEPNEFVGVSEENRFDEQPLQKYMPAGENEKAPEQESDDDRFASIPTRPASESLLEVQAIAWSKHSKKRIAVINGHIVHEGESVESVTVKHIGKGTVVFQQGGEAWRQVFRITSNFK